MSGERIILFIRYYLYWLLFFVVQKPIFMLWQHRLMGDITFGDYFRVIVHAFPLDLSVASYVMLVMGLILIAGCWMPQRAIRIATDALTAIVLVVGLFVMIGDNGCFPSWGYHWDKTVFVFLATPKDAMASAPWWMWLLGALAFVLLFAGWWWLYRRYVFPKDGTKATYEHKSIRSRLIGSLCYIMLTGLLILPIRGSVTVSTMNTGRVYFSDNQMLNIAAINPLFNIVESLGENTFDVQKYTYMSSEEAEERVNKLLRPREIFMDTILADTPSKRILRTERPHIVLFILESFSLNAWEAMPCLQALSKEGIWFSHTYAGSYRTDRGVVEVMSAFPGQPTSSLMTVPYKSERLPNIGKTLKAAGYDLHFYYGGDEDFTNMRSYLISGGFDRRVSDRDFPMSARMSKWGVPDHILIPYAQREIAERYEQDTLSHLDVILTLSSHEPFEVPMRRLEHPYLNSICYTDSCLGAFVDSMRLSSEWNNTLLVFVADHGFPYPDGLPIYVPERFRILSLWAGGAVTASQEVTTLCSQADIVPTLLKQMDLQTEDYVFAKNIFDATHTPFAFFAFNDGFGLLTEQDTVVIDAKADKVLVSGTSAEDDLAANEETLRTAKAFIQRIMETIDKL